MHLITSYISRTQQKNYKPQIVLTILNWFFLKLVSVYVCNSLLFSDYLQSRNENIEQLSAAICGFSPRTNFFPYVALEDHIHKFIPKVILCVVDFHFSAPQALAFRIRMHKRIVKLLCGMWECGFSYSACCYME